jgi:uncharacterized protein (TIGR00369 family)
MSTQAPAARRSAEEQASLDAALTELFERRISFNQTLGLVVESASAQGPRIRFDMRPELIGHYLHGRLHGGVISATLDAMGGLALMAAIGERHAHESTAQVMHRFSKMGTIDLRVDFLRPGVGAHFIARAEVIRLGGRIGATQMRLTNEQGTLIATGSAAYVIS